MTFSKETQHESKDSKPPGMTFQSFALAAPLLKNVAELGFTQPTEVQAQVIPAALAGGDLLVSSQTGSGKTAAFLLPLINQLIDANPNNSPVPGRAQPAARLQPLVRAAGGFVCCAGTGDAPYQEALIPPPSAPSTSQPSLRVHVHPRARFVRISVGTCDMCARL